MDLYTGPVWCCFIGIDKTPKSNSMFNHSIGIMDGDFATTLNQEYFGVVGAQAILESP